VNNGDGTLTDHQTGLMWELKTSACSGEITCVNNQYTWSSSATASDGSLFTSFLATLDGGDYASLSAGQDVSNGPTPCFANHCDWRIPTIAELNTIIETSAPGCTTGSPCIDPAFGPTQASNYWSSSSWAGDPNGAWFVNFFNGNVSLLNKTDGIYARAVRSGR
jgi:hypothetical protein